MFLCYKCDTIILSENHRVISMRFSKKLMQAYFNCAYNPVYDFTVARLSRYRKLQERCVNKLELKDNDRVLCVGIGTGNEVFHILEMNSNVNIVGIDFSKNAIKEACKKALKLGREIDVYVMDAQSLDFPAESFDKVLCLHVMDFVGDVEKVTREIFRVLKDDGQFVTTYPSGKEDAKMAYNLLKANIQHAVDSGKSYIRAYLELLVQVIVGMTCIPLLFRSGKKFFSHQELEMLITGLKFRDFMIEEDPLYRDFITSGKK